MCPAPLHPPLRAALACAVLLLGACSTPPPAAPQLPAVPGAFRHAGPDAPDLAISPTSPTQFPTPPAAAVPAEGWWKVFRDAELDRLEAEATSGNTSLQLAAARLAKARALVRGAQAARGPQLGLRGGVDRQGGPIINAAGGEGTLLTALADLSWEVDLFGRLQQSADAATLDAQSQEALLRDARLLVQANLAQAYFSLRALDAERALVDAAVQSWRESAAITGQRFRSGSVAELEWVRAQAELAAVESEAQALARRRTELEHALAVLAGAPASSFEIAPRAWDAALPAIPAGVPGVVLARRPDVAAAQRSVAAAQVRLGLARTAWFPSLTLTATGGSASPDLGNLLQASTRVWSVAALLGVTLFDAGKREAGIEAADADLQAALASYREQILVALRDVEDQLSALQRLAREAQVQASAVTLGQRTALLAESRYRSGLASQLDVLDARRTELRNEREALQVRSARYQATVRLIRALGGGWEVAKAP